MKEATRVFLAVLVGMFGVTGVFGQVKQSQTMRRPSASTDAAPQTSPAPAPSGQYFSILDGLPVLLEVHHDTEVGTGKSINVYMFVIEMQIMNSDGNLEPVGLQIHNYYTMYPQDPKNDVNPHNARDCRTWNGLVLSAIRKRGPKSKTWPYIEFMTAEGARSVQTNEDGPVWWSDDVQCWGSSDRFPPF